MRRPTPTPTRRLVAALDVGTSKVSAMIAEPTAWDAFSVCDPSARTSEPAACQGAATRPKPKTTSG